MGKMKLLVDGGSRTLFNSGAFREIVDDKGRCDLVYNSVFGEIYNDHILTYIECFVRTGEKVYILDVIRDFISNHYNDPYTAYLELSKHYADGAKKYEERNFEKGLPAHCYVDSGLRHYVKLLRGDTDEPHDRAFLWNMISLIYTIENKPEYIDLPYLEIEKENK